MVTAFVLRLVRQPHRAEGTDSRERIPAEERARKDSRTSGLLLLPHPSRADTLADFGKALAELQPGKQYTAREYLHCVGREEACSRLEGELGNVRITLELKEGTISSVLIVAEGERPALEALLAWAREGPPHAVVEAADATWERAEGAYPGFLITG